MHRAAPMWSECPVTTRVWLSPVVALALFCCLLLDVGEAQVQPKRILIFYEVGIAYPGVNQTEQGLVAAFDASHDKLEIYREYLETVLFPDFRDQERFREFYIRKYKDRRPDVIITVGPSPLKFMVETHKQAFPGVPIVFCLPAWVPSALTLDSDFAGAVNDLAPAETVETALRLLPGTKHIVVVGGTSFIDVQIGTVVKEQLRPYESRFDISYLTNLTMPDLQERLHHLPDHAIVLLTSLSRDAQGATFIAGTEGTSMVTAAANAPVFVLYRTFLNHGEVGGKVFSHQQQGSVAGELALRILNGEKPRDLPRINAGTIPTFDWRALKRWGLSERSLPQGSIVLNRQPTLWDSYKWYIVSGLCLLFAQTSLILGLLWQRASRRKAEGHLKESEKRFRLVSNTAPVMIWMSGTDKMCNYFNKPWLDFTGRSLEEELGNGWAEGVHNEDFADCLKTYAQAFDKQEQFEVEYRLRRHDGEYRWVFDIGVPRFNDGVFAGYIGSVIDVTERKRAEEALSTIGRRLIEAHEEERTWIGRELHDDINQRLALLAVELEQRSQGEPRKNLSEYLNHVQEQITEISEDVQALSHRLHSSKLDYLGLTAAARSFCKEASEKAKAEVQFSHSSVPTSLPKDVSLCLFRVLQEALQNAIKYSGVRFFHVSLRGTPDGVELTVSDDGKGFDERDSFSSPGLGLISMRERLQMLHGVLEIKTYSGAGTTISARIPLQETDLRAKAG